MSLTEKPKKGDRVCWPGLKSPGGRVSRVVNDICFYLPDGGDKETCFIWWFERTQSYNESASIESEGGSDQ